MTDKSSVPLYIKYLNVGWLALNGAVMILSPSSYWAEQYKDKDLDLPVRLTCTNMGTALMFMSVDYLINFQETNKKAIRNKVASYTIYWAIGTALVIQYRDAFAADKFSQVLAGCGFILAANLYVCFMY
eukprot:67782_1